MQLRGSSRPGSIISAHPLPILLEPEPPVSHELLLECRERSSGVLRMSSLPSSSAVSPQPETGCERETVDHGMMLYLVYAVVGINS
jgi:hypothetical protein